MNKVMDKNKTNAGPSAEGKLKFVDFARGFAIFTIVFMHLTSGLDMPGSLKKALSFGGAGVHMFILCSGFGLYLSHLRRKLSYAEFLSRRMRKVYLPYCIAVLLWIAYYAIRTHTVDWNSAASHFFLYKMFDSDLDVSICYHYWFISTIIQFYICWPLILRLMQLRHGLLIACAVSFSWAAAVGSMNLEESRAWGSCIFQYLWEFCLGMTLAKNAASIEERIHKLGLMKIALAAVVGIAATGAMGSCGGFLKLFNDLPSLVGYTACALLVYRMGIGQICRFFEFTSRFGYEWYLLHGLTIMSMLAAFPGWPVHLTVVASFCVSYGLGWLFSLGLKRCKSPHRKDFPTASTSSREGSARLSQARDESAAEFR